ncbi:MAG: hypothetical protein ACYCVD_16780 [Desulfitobacteriaceae bacterium]
MKNREILNSDSETFWEWWHQGAKELQLIEKVRFKNRLKRSE